MAGVLVDRRRNLEPVEDYYPTPSWLFWVLIFLGVLVAVGLFAYAIYQGEG